MWHSVVKARRFKTPHEVRAAFPASSFLGEGVTVFNITGNKYRQSLSGTWSATRSTTD
ncbi:MAG: type II toxin-antitoxin system HigB family toxin [Gemmatimonadaceae bacterium]